MKDMLDMLLKILKRERGLYSLALKLTHREKASVLGGDLNAFKEATRKKSSLVLDIQELEKERQRIIESLADRFHQPSRELNLRKLIQLVEAPYAAKLEACRSELLQLTKALAKINSHNRELIVHSLKLVRSSFSFLNNLAGSNTIYQHTGKMLSPAYSGRVLFGEI